MRRLRPRAALALVALMSLIGAGCGADAPSESATAGSSGTAGTTGTGGSSRKLTAQEKGVKFAECIRAHGVGDFPDPNPKGQFEYGVSVSREVWTKAVDACKDLQPPGTLSGDRTPKQQAASLRLAQCVRANGVKDFPDPVNGDPIVDTTKIPSSNRPGGMTILNAALQKCRSVLEEVLGGQR